MENTAQKNTSLSGPSISTLLASKALNETLENGTVKTLCPKCGKKPKVTITKNGDEMVRSYVRCACGYVESGEIYM